jgi:hypothetical protein
MHPGPKKTQGSICSAQILDLEAHCLAWLCKPVVPCLFQTIQTCIEPEHVKLEIFTVWSIKINRQFHVNRYFLVSLRKREHKINAHWQVTMNLSNGKYKMNACPVHNQSISLPIVLSPSLHPAMCTQPCFMLIQRAIWIPFSLKTPDTHNGLWFGWHVTMLYDGPVTMFLMIINFMHHC